ncbi:2,3-bisphosphoglycerate-independent phosphoglycerate mutase [bacterium]|nr:2,3-bisphosphoglycerate-independent phosphoglycerate mutase [bacterium]
MPTLQPSSRFTRRKPVVLIIMDGVGIGKPTAANAVYMAKTPTLDWLQTLPTYRLLKAHGTAVGMPSDEDMGNSEVGHNALGAGRVFDQGASLVKRAIETGSLLTGPVWTDMVHNTIQHQSTFHWIGLLSDGNVHSHIDHLIAMIQDAAANGVKRGRVHILLDGRDVAEKSALTYIGRLNMALASINLMGADFRIASGGGRMVTTMDRYNADWSIVERGWNAHVLGKARPFQDASVAVSTFYSEDPNITDQYLPSFTICDESGPIGCIYDNDSVVMFNFRGDRAIELTMAFENDTFPYFDRIRRPKVLFAGMMQYDGDLKLPERYLVNPPTISNSIGYYMCQSGLKSFAISETQKYGHVTYFWNGNNSGYLDKSLETYIEIPSDTIQFDQRPAMKAIEITDKAIELIESGCFDFGRINYPNGDMVGHTGNLSATIESVEITDQSVRRIIDSVIAQNGITVILADHGNADEMFTEKNGLRTPKTAHTLNPVPFAIVDSNPDQPYQLAPIPTAGLANVAATLCNLLGFDAPMDYESSLIVTPQSNVR